MARHVTVVLSLALVCAACAGKPTAFDWGKYQPPDWQRYQARSAPSDDKAAALVAKQQDVSAGVTFRDLKSESDRSLAGRLLGAVGKRIAYIDRHKERWAYYSSDSDAVESIDLYTHPDALGSQYGVCGSEKYSVSFDKTGHVSTVSMTMRYGVEGPLFQRADFDWKYYYSTMCSSASASHVPSYFPATDSIMAQDAAMLLLPVIDIAGSAAALPYRLKCRQVSNQSCDKTIRKYIASLRLEDVDDFGLANCPLPGGPKEICFTVKTGENKLGPYPKMITVKGSTYMNNVRVDAVEVDEGFTMS